MRKPIVLLLGAISLAALANVACSRERPAAHVGTTTVRSGEVQPSAINVEEVRTVLLARKPGAADTINALIITNENGVIDLKGKVEDDATKADLINHVRAMPGVKGVRDDLKVHAKRAEAKPEGKVGTTTTTGATEEMHATRADAVRHSMKTAQPMSEEIIRALVITDDGEIITVTGVVPDEDTHKKLLKAAKDAPGVKGVRDEIKVKKAGVKEKTEKDKAKGKGVKYMPKEAKETAKDYAKEAKDAAKDAKEAAKEAKGAAKDAKDAAKEKAKEPTPANPKLNPVKP
jgi:osmotically-inducible protein OsmY